MSMFLTDEEMTELTGKKRREARRVALNTMGVEHIIRPDGMVKVLRSHVESMMGGFSHARIKDQKKVQPNWECLNA